MAAHARARERETECWEAGGEPVAQGDQKARIDVFWLGPLRKCGWWNRWRVVKSGTMALGPVRLHHQGLLTPRPPLAHFSVCWIPPHGLPHATHSSNTQWGSVIFATLSLRLCISHSLIVPQMQLRVLVVPTLPWIEATFLHVSPFSNVSARSQSRQCNAAI